MLMISDLKIKFWLSNISNLTVFTIDVMNNIVSQLFLILFLPLMIILIRFSADLGTVSI